MLTIAVCDDDIKFANKLTNKIKNLMSCKLPKRIQYEIVPAFNSAQEVLDYMNKHYINVLFLDIDMPDCTGFELAGKLNDLYFDIIIVFVSAYENFVYSSFDYSPFRFIRKTHLDTELSETIEKIIDRYIVNQERLTVLSATGEVDILIKDITYFESQRNYYIIHCFNNTYRCRGTLNNIEETIREFDFYRIHAAYIINMQNIEKLDKNHTVLMKCGKILNISQQRMPGFRKAYLNFIRTRVR